MGDKDWQYGPREYPVRVSGEVRLKASEVIARAVEEGVTCGWRRAHKHTDQPSAEGAIEAIETAVMAALDEVLDFDEPARTGFDAYVAEQMRDPEYARAAEIAALEERHGKRR